MPQNVRAAIIACESGGRNIENGGDAGGVSTASGIFQFTDGTWRTFGGREFASRAIGATEAEQTIVADRAFEANGLRDWEASRACWQPRVGEAKHAADTLRHGRSPPQHSAESYTVKRGDTLSEIAAAHHTTWQKLYAANRDTVSNPDRIYPGEHLDV